MDKILHPAGKRMVCLHLHTLDDLKSLALVTHDWYEAVKETPLTRLVVVHGSRSFVVGIGWQGSSNHMQHVIAVLKHMHRYQP